MEKLVNGKKITCAVVIINKDGDILGCHPTSHPEVYDFPKGCAEEGEMDMMAAVRELREETDILLYDENWNVLHELIDCGVYPHLKEKNIHIFLYKVNSFPDLSTLKCTSMFEAHGKQFPEVDRYKIIKKDERHLFMKCLQNKFDIIDSFNK